MAGRIVVGVDGSQEAARALHWAANEAALRKCKLEVVHAWSAPWDNWGGKYATTDLEHVTEQQESALANELEPVMAAHPDLDVEPMSINELPARALLDRAKDADVLVVGSRGKGGFAGLLLGSVSQQLVHHAPCPVVIIPPEH